MEGVAKKALEQLLAVRDDLARTRDFGRTLEPPGADPDRLSVHSWRSAASFNRSTASERLDPPSPNAAAPAKSASSSSMAAAAANGSKPAPSLLESSRSVSQEEGWESRIAEFRRLRTPSPSPRKITNYPDPPPSMVIRKCRSCSCLHCLPLLRAFCLTGPLAVP